MRFTVVDPRGRVSFIAPCSTLEALVAACASESQPRTVEQFLRAAEPFVGELAERVLSGLAVFDEHNSPTNYRWIHAALDYCLPQEAPVFRVVDPRTEEISLSPVRAGVVVFNLLAKRIVQLQTRILNDPNDVASRLELARWMLESGQVEEGLKRTREVLRTDPDHGPTHRLLADYYARRGDHGLANYHRVRSSTAQEAK